MTMMGHVRGSVRSIHLFTQAPEIIRDFGWRVWMRGLLVLMSGKVTTFLDLTISKK